MLNVIYESLGFSPELAGTIGRGHFPEGIVWSACNISTDVCCLLIPAAIVLPLELRPAKKLSVIALFALGTIPNAAGIWSIVFFQRIVQEIAAIDIADAKHLLELRDYSSEPI
ncbi:uncharacterized protein PG998_009278 [Apiospora kogelbergensis]|uniref:uncharacterized protein n=1 Tax=Apiospora kogelbergensis TaxID=1337665 RepID=UPI0031313ED7